MRIIFNWNCNQLLRTVKNKTQKSKNGATENKKLLLRYIRAWGKSGRFPGAMAFVSINIQGYNVV